MQNKIPHFPKTYPARALGIYPVGVMPVALAFDGASLWVANQGDKTVSKLSARNGAAQGTFPVAGTPTALTFTGDLWVAGGGSLLRLRASDGATLGTIPIATQTVALTFDGTHLWMSHLMYGGVSKVDATTGVVLNTFYPGQSYANPAPNVPYAAALVFDGTKVWAAFNDGSVRILSAGDGAFLGTVQVTDSGGSPPWWGVKLPVSLAFDGVHVWVTDNNTDGVKKL